MKFKLFIFAQSMQSAGSIKSSHPLNQTDSFKGINAESYYSNFTRYVLTNQSCENSIDVSYSREDWLADPNSIQSLHINQLKSILKSARLRVSGKKQELIQRLKGYYRRIGYAITIQRVFRGFLVRESERMRGPGYPNTNLCLNETDFHTMDLLCRIPREEFFSYRDATGFVYGFNVFSLMAMFKRNRKTVNPYNREDIPIPIVCKVFSIYKKILLLYPLTCNLARFDEQSRELAQIVLSETRSREDAASLMESDSDISSVTLQSDLSSVGPDRDTRNLTDGLTESALHRLSRLRENYSVQERIIMVFERINALTNDAYNANWFENLSKHKYDMFYHFYLVWWSRSKNAEICPLDNPFYAASLFDENSTRDYYRLVCLELIENMVYTGTNEHWQCKGAEQVTAIFDLLATLYRHS